MLLVTRLALVVALGSIALPSGRGGAISPELARVAATAFIARLQAKDATGAVALSDPVLTDGGFVVFVGRGGKLGGVLLIRVKDKVAKVVGIG